MANDIPGVLYKLSPKNLSKKKLDKVTVRVYPKCTNCDSTLITRLLPSKVCYNPPLIRAGNSPTELKGGSY